MCLFAWKKRRNIPPFSYIVTCIFINLYDILISKTVLGEGKGSRGWEGEGEEEGEGKEGAKEERGQRASGRVGRQGPRSPLAAEGDSGAARRRTAAATKARTFRLGRKETKRDLRKMRKRSLRKSV